MENEIKNNVIAYFSQKPEVGLVYFFGSRAKGMANKMSDYDFAIYLNEENQDKRKAKRSCPI